MRRSNSPCAHASRRRGTPLIVRIRRHLLFLFVVGLKKKVLAIGKKRGYERAVLWWPSINRHLYYCAHHCEGDQDLLEAMWRSVINHVCGVHEGHSDRFPKCLHGDIGPREYIAFGTLIAALRTCLSHADTCFVTSRHGAVKAYSSCVCIGSRPVSIHRYSGGIISFWSCS
jgi:hypothetical protein